MIQGAAWGRTSPGPPYPAFDACRIPASRAAGRPRTARPEADRSQRSRRQPAWEVHDPPAPEKRYDEVQVGVEEVSRPAQHILFPQTLADHPQPHMGEVPDTAVQQLGGPSRSRAGKVVLLHQRHGQSPARRIPGHRGADHSPPTTTRSNSRDSTRARRESARVHVPGGSGTAGARGSAPSERTSVPDVVFLCRRQARMPTVEF